MGREGSQSQAVWSLRGQPWKRVTPHQLCWGPWALSLMLPSPSIHMSVCAVQALPQAWLGSEHVGSATSGKEGVDAWGWGWQGPG